MYVRYEVCTRHALACVSLLIPTVAVPHLGHEPESLKLRCATVAPQAAVDLSKGAKGVRRRQPRSNENERTTNDLAVSHHLEPSAFPLRDTHRQMDAHKMQLHNHDKYVMHGCAQA
ncbi:hypothetical protein HD806DRAFT_25222 [Xylariaceae sp. AK1471]|nr:hypothetical protein HD806DRAFT_25222 [Xylariaceae sp. AK1471]